MKNIWISTGFTLSDIKVSNIPVTGHDNVSDINLLQGMNEMLYFVYTTMYREVKIKLEKP